MSILDLPRDEFLAMLPELRQQGVDTDALLRQYRSANSPFAGINEAATASQAALADDGRRQVAGGLLSKPEGATGMDAVRGLDTNFIGGLLNMLSGGGQAIDAPMAAAQGLIPQGDMALEALGTAGAAMTGGGAAVAPRGSLRAGLARSGDIDADVAMARQAVLDNPNDASLFDQYKAIRRERDALGSRPETAPVTQFAAPDDEGFAAYLERVNPQGTRIEAEARPNLAMGDMYGMLPRNARKVSERDGVTFYQAQDGATYATAFNPDVGEMDVVGYSMPGGNSTDLAVVSEMQGRGIGGELQYLARSQDPYAQTGGLTDAGRGSLERTYNRLRDDGTVAANANTSGGLLATAASDALTPSQQMARRILDMRAAGRASEVTDDMMAQADPQVMFNETPLPMDAASRAARADQMFPDEAFHSTRADFPAFEIGDVGYHVGTDEQAGQRLIGTRREFGSDGENILPVRIAPGRSLLSKDAGEWNDARFAGQTLQDAGLDVADITDEALDIAGSFEDNDFWKQSYENTGLLGEMRDRAEAQGYGSIKYANEVENEYGDMAGLTRQGKQMSGALRNEWNDIEAAITGRRPSPPDIASATPESVQAWLAAPKPVATPEEAARISQINQSLQEINSTMMNDGSSTIMFDPRNIRSQFARFDPEFAHLSNLSAANASPLGGLLAMPQEQEKKELPFMALLKGLLQ